jgi:hypothetical protein
MRTLDFLKLLKDDFDAHEDAFLKLDEDAFLKLLAQSIDVLKKSLHYILLTAMEPTDFARTAIDDKAENDWNAYLV